MQRRDVAATSGCRGAGSEFLAARLECVGPVREAAILDAVRAGRFVLDWSPIQVQGSEHVLQFRVSSDVLRHHERLETIADPAVVDLVSHEGMLHLA